MKEKLFSRDEESAPARAIEFAIMPPLRCAHVEENPDRKFCGELASYMRLTGRDEGSRFVCAAHCDGSEVSIAGELAIRLVTFQVEIVFAGVVPFPRIAQLEALMRLNQAVERAGGLLNLHGATSQLGRWTPPRPAGGQNPDSGVQR